jgi:hypothetical protein
MTVEEFSRKLAITKQLLTNNRDSETLIIAREARALIVRRIQNDRKDAMGQSYGGYSDNDLPLWFYRGKSLNIGNEKKVQAAGKKQGGKLSYVDFRRLNNLQTEAVDMTFTGGMWKETTADIIASTPDRSVATITGRTNRARKLLGFNSERYGDVLKLSKLEVDMLERANKQRVLKIIRQVF